MKRNIITKMLVLPALLGLTTACSDNYLDVAPETSVSTSDVTGNVEVARQAIYGICASMEWGYENSGSGGTGWINTGEAYLNTMCNDALGQDYICGRGITRELGANGVKLQTLANSNYVINNMPWMYCYSIIQQANSILSGIEHAEGTEEERNFRWAQCLTFRAFGYMKLLQWYAPRWEDSNNGERYCVVLRTEPGTGPTPLVTMNTVLEQIYKDIEKANELYDKTSMDRDYKWEPNQSVANGVLARAALIKHDWATAQKAAHDARQGFEIMDNKTMYSGQTVDNNDFMWTQSAHPDDLGYWNWGGWFSCNGAYISAWDRGAGAIDLQLYNQLDEKDARRAMFITPDKLNATSNSNPGKLTEADFWNKTLVGTSLVQMNYGPAAADRKNPNKKWGLTNFVMRYVEYYKDNICTGSFEPLIDSDGTHYGYYTLTTKSSGSSFKLNSQYYVTVWKTPIGAQLKFISTPNYGSMYYPFMRAAEMCLAEAEAAYMNGDMETAKSCLTEINAKRIEGYTCDKSGDALLEEIKLCRRIELWGEGQSWSDFKRWNWPMNRIAWSDTNPGGNWIPICEGEVPTTAGQGWRFSVPAAEWQYNHLIDRTLLSY